MSRRTARSHKGRRPLLTPDTQKRITDAVRAGLPYHAAAQAAGISTSSFYSWLARARTADETRSNNKPTPADEQPYLDLLDELTRAKAEGALRNTALVQKVAAGGFVVRETTRRYRDSATGQVVTETDKQFAAPDWRASAWVLDRRHREWFGQGAQQVEVTGAAGGPVEVSLPEIEGLAARVRAHIDRARDELGSGDVVDGELVEP